MEQHAEFKISNIEVLSSSFNSHNFKEEVTDYNFKLDAQIKIAPEQKTAISIVQVAITQANQNTSVGHYSAAVHFLITNFEDVIHQEDSHLTLPDILVGILNSIAISTVRGMMFEAFRGTFLHTAILPIVDIHKLIQENIAAKKEV